MFRYLSVMIGAVLVAVLLTVSTVLAQKTMSVQVREGQLRVKPSHFGKIVAQAAYGDRVTVLEEKGDWKKVSVAGGKYQGWMHVTALTGKKIVLKAGPAGAQTSVTRDEIALAGKGFSEEVEAQYRKTHKNLDYTWINRMETFKVTPEELESFVTEGRLAADGRGGER